MESSKQPSKGRKADSPSLRVRKHRPSAASSRSANPFDLSPQVTRTSQGNAPSSQLNVRAAKLASSTSQELDSRLPSTRTARPKGPHSRRATRSRDREAQAGCALQTYTPSRPPRQTCPRAPAREYNPRRGIRTDSSIKCFGAATWRARCDRDERSGFALMSEASPHCTNEESVLALRRSSTRLVVPGEMGRAHEQPALSSRSRRSRSPSRGSAFAGPAQRVGKPLTSKFLRTYSNASWRRARSADRPRSACP